MLSRSELDTPASPRAASTMEGESLRIVPWRSSSRDKPNARCSSLPEATLAIARTLVGAPSHRVFSARATAWRPI